MKKLFHGMVSAAIFTLFSGCNATVHFNITSDPTGAMVHSESAWLGSIMPMKYTRGKTPASYDVSIWRSDAETAYVIWPDGVQSLPIRSGLLGLGAGPFNWHFNRETTTQNATPQAANISQASSKSLSALQQGQDLYNKGAYHEALPFLKTAVQEAPDNWIPYNWLGWCYYGLDKYEDAITQFKIAQGRTENGSNCQGLGSAYYALQNFDEAARYFSKWSDLEPKNFMAYSQLAWSYYYLERYNDALTHFTIAGKLADNPDLYVGLGSAYRKLGRLDEAAAAWKHVLTTVAVDDENGKLNILMNLADCYIAQGNFAEARKVLGDRKVIGLEFKLDEAGLYVVSVMKGWPADRGGIKVGDILTLFGEHELQKISMLDFANKIIPSVPFDSVVKIRVLRNGKSMTANVRVGITEKMAVMEKPVVAQSEEPILVPIGVSKWAICIGISTYKYKEESGLMDLPFATDDASAFAGWLKETGWRDDHIRLLTDENATERNIRIAMESWLTKVKPQDLIILYWAGHGYSDPEDPEKVYFACHDTDANIPATGFRMDRVVEILKERRTKNVVVFADTCHAGKLITRGERGLSVLPSVKKMQQQDSLPNGWVFMVSADSDRQAVEHSSWRHGAFTHCLMQGLRGNADGFQSTGAKDGTVTLGELRAYLTTSMPDETQKVLGAAKHPLITTNSGDPSIWDLTLK